MSQKERDYIASCFDRAFKSSKSDLDYKSIFEGKKVEYDISEKKREIKKTFGKQEKRSKKWAKPSIGSSTTFLENEMLISELFGIVNILRFVNLEVDYYEEIENSLLTYFESSFSQIIDYEKIFVFMKEFLEVGSKRSKKQFLKFISKKCNEIQKSKFFSTLIQNIASQIFSDKTLLTDDIWECDGWYDLAYFILLENKNLTEIIYCSFLNIDSISLNEQNEASFTKFITLICSYCSPSQRSKILKKISTKNSKSIENLVSELSITKN